MSETPSTLPANFFEKKSGQASPPQTLPANFDFKAGKVPDAPKPDTDAQRGAAQATGLRPQQKGDDILSAFLDSPKGKEMEKANVDAWKFGLDALPAVAALRGIRGAFKPSVAKVAVPTGLFDSSGQPIMHEVEKLGKSAIGKGAEVASKWINDHPKSAFLLFELARELAISPKKTMEMVHVIGKK